MSERTRRQRFKLCSLKHASAIASRPRSASTRGHAERRKVAQPGLGLVSTQACEGSGAGSQAVAERPRGGLAAADGRRRYFTGTGQAAAEEGQRSLRRASRDASGQAQAQAHGKGAGG